MEIIRLHTLTRAGCRALAAMFNRLYAMSQRMTGSKSYVNELLRQAAGMPVADKNRVPRPVPKNRTWGLDLTGKKDLHGKTHYILGMVDHGTRYAVCLRVLPDKSARTILNALRETVVRYGKPDFIRTDNEAVFTCSAFRNSLVQPGIRQQFSELHKPWQNGRIERLFGTLKGKLSLVVVKDFAELDAAITEFRTWYNRVRPHQHLNGWTPEEAWLAIDPWLTPYKRALPYSGWDGLLKGYFLIR